MTSKIVLPSLLLSLVLLHGCAAPVIVAGGAAAGAAATDRRTTGSIVEDQSIELKAKQAIYTDPALKEVVHINVTSYNGIVLLSGEAPTQEARQSAARHTQHVDRVRKIHNEILLAPKSSLKARSKDAWITTKAKTALLGQKQLNALAIKVVTENQIVYLMGLVDQKESQLAVDAVRKIDGVKQVVKLFEYK